MLPKSVPTPPGAPAIAGDRPQLKIAPRAQDARNGQQDGSGGIRDSAVVITDELSGWHGEWRRTLETMKATLADLGQACESAIDAREAEVAGLVDTLVESARAEATTAAEQTREQAQIEITRLQQSLAEVQTRADTLQSDLDAERDSVKTLREQLEMDGAARVRAEAERDEARRECQQQMSAAELQARGLRSESDGLRGELKIARQQLDEAVAETSKATATLQLIQRALAQGMPVNVAVQNETRSGDGAALAESRPCELRAENSSVLQPPAIGASPVADPQVALAAAHPDVVEDIKRVLEQVESIYNLDLNAGRVGTELVDSLTGSLRYARDLIVARWSRDGCDAAALFEYQMAVLLDLNVATSFGRHLSISACASRKLVASPTAGNPDAIEKTIS